MSTNNTTKTKLSATDVLADYDQLILGRMQGHIANERALPYTAASIEEIHLVRTLLQNIRNTETGTD
jgi:hypothetical protein